MPAARWFRTLALPLALGASGICAQAPAALPQASSLAAQSQDTEFATARDSHGTLYTGGSGGAFVAREGGWRVRLGTEAGDSVLALGAAPDGSIYAAGTMGTGGFVAKLTSQGVLSALLKLDTPVRALAIDSDGSVYVGGNGVMARLSPSLTMEDRFATGDVTALAARGGTVWVAFRYLPGYLESNMKVVDLGADTHVEAMTMDPSGAIYAAGTTTAPDLPNARNHLNGPSDAFVARLDTATGGVGWSQYVGGSGAEEGTGIGWDRDGSLLVMGHTKSTDFPGEVKGDRFKAHADPPYQLGLSVMPESDAGGTDSIIVYGGAGAWGASSNASWLHTSSSGSAPGGVAVFTIDANSGTAARTGTLTIGGQTLTVEQAGTDYLKAPTVVYSLDSDTLLDGLAVSPGLAVDSSRNLFYANNDTVASIQGGINEWNASTQTVTKNLVPPSGQTGTDSGLSAVVPYTGGSTLTVYAASFYSTANDLFSWTSAGGVTVLANNNDFNSGAGAPMELAIDTAGNLYIDDLYSPGIWVWNGSTLTALGNNADLEPNGSGSPTGVAVDLLNNIYVIDTVSEGIFKGTLAAGLPQNPSIATGTEGGNNAYDLSVDASGNLYFIDQTDAVVWKWKYSATTGSFSSLSLPLPISGSAATLKGAGGMVVSGAGNYVFRANGICAGGTTTCGTATGIFMLPNAYIDTAAVNESGNAGSDSLPAVVPSTTILGGPFLPTSDQTWLTIGTPSNGVVNFSFTANTGSARTAHITVLGQTVAVTQAQQTSVPPSMTLSFSPTTVKTNAASTLTFSITNSNSGTIQANFTDSLPANMQVAPSPSVSSNCAGGAGAVTAIAGEGSISYATSALAAGTCNIHVNVIATVDNTYVDSVTIDSSDAGNATSPSSATLTVVNPPTITKSFSPTSIPVNGTSTITLALANPNTNTALTGVDFSDNFPTGMKVANPTGIGSTCTGTWNATAGDTFLNFGGGTLPAGSSCNLTVNVTSTTAGVYNNATNAPQSNQTNAGVASNTATLTVIAAPSIGKAFELVSQIAASPAGATESASTVTITTTSPHGFLTGQSVTIAGVGVAGYNGTFTIASVPTTTTFTYTDTNTGLAASGGGTATAPITTMPLHGTATLAFTLTNANGSTLTGVSFTDLFPSGLVVANTPNASAPCGTFTAVAGATSVTFSAGTLAGSATCTVSVDITATAAGLMTNTTGDVTSNEGGTGTTSNTATLTVLSPPSISKAFGVANISPGGTTTLTFTITNPDGSNQLLGVAFTDPLPSGLAVASTPAASTSCGGTFSPNGDDTTLNFSGGTIAASGTCSVAVNVTATSPGPQNNTTGNVTSTNGGMGNTASASIAVGEPPTATTVTPSQGTITLGDTVTFTATVTGTGTPTELVIFFDGNTPLGSATLNGTAGNDQATFSTSLLSAGTHSITAVYQGDPTDNGSTSSAISETVNPRTSTTGVVLNPTTVVVGQGSTATVTLTDSGSVPPGTADTFATTGAPAMGRTGFTSTFFADFFGDGLVLVAGGTDANNNVLKSAEIYSVTDATFSATSDLDFARTGAVAVLLPNGKVLVAGGSSDGTANGALSSAELFDPAGRAFVTTNSLSAARFGATATLLNTGKVLIAGGENSGGVLSSAELYDPVAGTFAATGPLHTARTGASATLLGTGKVLIAGGSSDGTALGALDTAELFDPAGNSGAGTFTTVAGANPTLAAGRWQPEAAVLLSGKVLVAGGQDSGGALTSADLYDPVADSFTASNQSMAQARANGTALALPNGMVLLAGGTTSQAVDLYDADSDKFDTTGSLQQSDSGLVSTLLTNGQVLVVGLTTAATPASDAELYSPSFNPLGTVGLGSSEATDGFGAACVLTPSTTTASTCSSTVTPVNVATSPHTITGTYPADAVHSTSNNTASLAVDQAGTTTTITANTPNPSVVGQSVSVSASVSANAPGSGTPTGTVTVSDGVGETCTITLSGGSGSCSLTPVAAATDTLTAHYNGDGNFNASTSTGVSQTVNKDGTTTAITANTPNPSVPGQAVSVSVTVAASGPGSGTPTGTVTVSDGVVVTCTITLISGSGSCNQAPVAPATYTLTAHYNGDSNFNASTSTGVSQTVNKGSATTAITAHTPNPSVAGQAVSVSASVNASAPASGTATGTVTVSDGVGETCTITLIGGSGSCSLTPVAAGTDTLTAHYNGDVNFNTSTSIGVSQTVNQGATTTAISANTPNPSVVGQSVSVSASVTANAPASGTPTGTVTVSDGAGQTCTITLSGGSGNCSLTPVAHGSDTLTAHYNSDGNFSASTSAGVSQTVNSASTSTGVLSSSNPSVSGQSVTFTATVTDNSAGSTAQPTGSVQFVVDSVPFGSPVPLTGATSTTSTATSQATATLSTAGSPHSVTANYVNVDGNFTNSTGSLIPGQTVGAAGTTTTVTPSSGAITLGDTVTFTATVAVNSPATGTPAGLVTFFDGATPIGSGTLNQSNPDQATFSTALLPVGSDSITAVYQGDANFAASPLSSATTETVSLRGTTTAVALNPTTVSTGEASTMTTTVTDSGASTPPGTPDVFTATGAPATGRTGFTSTLFADGEVLVAGGTGADGTTVLNSAEIYSVSGGTFSSTGNLNTARTGAVAVLLPTGKVLIAGGSGNGTAGGALNTADLFDPIAGTFTPTSHNMTAARFSMTATLLNNGKVLIAGGENSGGTLNSAELYDPMADTFTATGNLSAARTGASATLLGTGKVLIAGGSSNGTAAGALNSAEVFDPTGGTFTPVAGATPTLTTGRWQPQAAVLLSGEVLVAGGQDSSGALTSADLYDPVADSFTATAHPMSEARTNGTAVTLPNGMVLLAGGTSATTVDLYDAEGDKFDSTGSLKKFDTGVVSTLLNNGRMLVAGLTILDPPGQPAVVSDAELYSPSFNPLGTPGGSSSDGTDVFTTCALTPGTATASACNSTVTPTEVGTSPHTITGTYSADAVHSGSSNSASLAVTPSAPPTIAKEFGQNPAAQNGTVPVGFTIVNPNPASTLTGISFTDALPAGLVVATPNGVTNTCGGTVTAVPGASSLSLTGGTLGPPGPPPQSHADTRRGSKPRTTAAQGDCFISVALQVTGTGTISNTTGAISATESGPGNPSNTATVTVVLAPTLSKVFGSGQVVLGQGSTLTFNVANPNSSTPLSNLAFSDTLPSGLVVASPNGVAGTCKTDGASISATAGGSTIGMTNLSLGASGSCSFTVNVISTSAGVKSNTTSAVTATFVDDDGVFRVITGGTASASLAVVAPPTLSKGFSPSIIAVGASSTLTFTIGNPAGNGSTLHSISFSDLFPSGLAVSSTPGVGGTCVSGSNGTVTATAGATTVSYSGGVLAAGSSCTITMSVTATSSGTLTNTTGPITSTETPSSTGTATAALTVLVPTYMNANTGTTPQSTPVTQAFGTLLSVTVLAADDATPVPGITVTFTAPATGATGTFANSTNTTQATTNASGVATATMFTANTTAGGAYTVTAAASGPTTVNFLLTNTAGPPTQMSANANTTPQSAQVATAFGTPLSVTVKDAYNNPVPGVVVTFTAPVSGAGGTFVNTTNTTPATTNGNGVATATAFTAGTLAGGPYNVTASASGPPSVNFSLTNTPGPATQLLAHAGTPQSAQVTTAFGTLLAAIAEDQYNNPVSGVVVTFTAPSSGASGKFANSTNTTQATTGSNGLATASVFTANTLEGGPYTVAATASGLPTANFSLTNSAGPPAQMSANAGTTPQSAQVATAFGTLLSVTVKDAYNNLVPGVVVTFTAPSSGASGTFANTTHTTQATTNSSGVATATAFTAGTLAGGPYSVTASASGPPSVNFSLTDTVGPPTQLLAHAGTPQSAQVTAAFGTLLAALVEDQYNNPVPGVVVTFTAPGSGATGTFANATGTTQATTNGSGIATATAFTANTKSGTYNVIATATGLPSAAFALTNAAGPPAHISAPIATTPQATPVNTPFPVPLEVALLDQYMNPVPGVTVTFTTPTSGPSGTFASGMTTIQTTSDSNGIASATVTANGQAGGPWLASSAVTGFSEINYTLTNLPAGTVYKLMPNPVQVEYCAASNPANPPSMVQLQTPNALAFTVKLSQQAQDRIAIAPANGTSPQTLTVTALPNLDMRPGNYRLRYEVVFGNGSRLPGLAVLQVCGKGR